jgi:uncharacterized protein Veg
VHLPEVLQDIALLQNMRSSTVPKMRQARHIKENKPHRLGAYISVVHSNSRRKTMKKKAALLEIECPTCQSLLIVAEEALIGLCETCKRLFKIEGVDSFEKMRVRKKNHKTATMSEV